VLVPAIQAGLSAWLAVEMAGYFKLPYPIYSLVAAVIVSVSPRAAVAKVVVDRILATAVGATFGALVCELGGQGNLAIGLCASAMIAAFLSIDRPEAAKLAGYISGVVVMEHSIQSWRYAWDRFLETVLGIAAGYVVAVIGYRITHRPSSRAAPADSS